MTLPDSPPPRKARRRWLWFPWTLFVLLVVGWSAGWFWLRIEAQDRMDTTARILREAGYTVEWKSRSVGGFPFRLDVALTDVKVAEPSGWGISAPKLKGEAFVYAMDHWIAVAPEGLTLQRPEGGPVDIRGPVLRASLAKFDEHPPRISFEGTELTFTPSSGGQPFFLQRAERLELHTRSGPDDQGGVLLRIEGARAHLPGLLARLADGRPVSLTWDMVLSKMSAFDGRDWPTSARRWSASGGTVKVQRASLTAGDAMLEARSGALRVGPDGRVQGTLDLDLRRAAKALDTMTGGLLPIASAGVSFEHGQTFLGPLPIASAPRVY